jgi:hypothetical protein
MVLHRPIELAALTGSNVLVRNLSGYPTNQGNWESEKLPSLLVEPHIN